MAARVFFESNIFIYSYATDEPIKQGTARRLIDASQVVVSCQVLQECVNVLRKRMGHSPDRAVERVRPLLGYEVVPLTTNQVEQAWTIAIRYGLSTYDSAIVAAALQSRCTTIFSEDMPGGQTIEGVKIVNPFA